MGGVYLLYYYLLLLLTAIKKHEMMGEATSEIIEEEGIKGHFFIVGKETILLIRGLFPESNISIRKMKVTFPNDILEQIVLIPFLAGTEFQQQ